MSLNHAAAKAAAARASVEELINALADLLAYAEATHIAIEEAEEAIEAARDAAEAAHDA